ncbi:hypothetical protein [Brevundimonas sp. LjRoot202]|uniref:hypothetical protein n=1 Tax=Brevundimonas sp. LjRoot202 TaxID=3342281 RepID=UPI003ECEB4EF
MRMLSHDALTHALRVYDLVERARLHIGPGHEAKLRSLVTEAASIVSAEKAILKGVLSAQANAAQDLDRAKWTPGCRLPLAPRPQEHLHAANDEHVTTPELPASPVA